MYNFARRKREGGDSPITEMVNQSSVYGQQKIRKFSNLQDQVNALIQVDVGSSSPIHHLHN